MDWSLNSDVYGRIRSHTGATLLITGRGAWWRLHTAAILPYGQSIPRHMTFASLYRSLTGVLLSAWSACQTDDRSSPEWDCWGRTRLLWTYTPPQRAVEKEKGDTFKDNPSLQIISAASSPCGVHTSNRMTKAKRTARTNQNWEVSL